MRLSTAGLEIGVAAGIGVLAGQYLDERWGTEPWLTIALLLAGLAAGFRNLFHLVRRVNRDEFEPEDR